MYIVYIYINHYIPIFEVQIDYAILDIPNCSEGFVDILLQEDRGSGAALPSLGICKMSSWRQLLSEMGQFYPR